MAQADGTPTELYRAARSFNREFVAKSLSAGDQQLYENIREFAKRRYDNLGEDCSLPVSPFEQDNYAGGSYKGSRPYYNKVAARTLIKNLVEGTHGKGGEKYFAGMFGKAGVSTSLGFNFYDLRGPVQFLYPVNTPFRNSMPRIDRVNDGWGTAANWKATTNPGTPYAGATEGRRVGVGTPNDIPYTAAYKEMGDERQVTFTAQAAGEGFTDNVADEHLRGLHSLYLQEESMILMGNSGNAAGGNGYKLGTCPTPTNSQIASGSTFTSAQTVYVACVALTPLGYPANSQYGYNGIPTPASGLTPTFTRANADGTTDTLNGGTSAISAISTVVTIASNSNSIVSTVGTNAGTGPGVEGAVGYAWFVSNANGANTLANMNLYAITAIPTVTITGFASNTNQAGNAAGLNVDASFQSLDFDGLRAYSQNAGGLWFSQYGQGPSGSSSLTPGKDGTIVEFENILETLATKYQAQPNKIYCGATSRLTVDQAMKYGGANGQPYVFFMNQGSNADFTGGVMFTAYQSKWAGNGGKGPLIPIEWHPQLPPGSIMFDVTDNPYPHSRVPFVRGLLVQRDYYSIEWPLVSRNWQFGTYVHETLAHYVPWITCFMDFVGAFVGN